MDNNSLAKRRGVSRKVHKSTMNPLAQSGRNMNRLSSSTAHGSSRPANTPGRTTHVLGPAAIAADRDTTRERVRQIMSGGYYLTLM